MQQPDLSVIVACYNVAPYLEDCLNSIVNTTFPHNRMEVLMVDDGSTDNKTPQIIDKYAKSYKNFKALHKTNGGASSCRNYGINHAHGKYIAFVDGDDLVTPNAYTDLMYVAEVYHSDIVSGFVRRFDNLRNHGSYLHKFAIIDNKFNTNIKQTPQLLYDTTCWNKVYNRNFINKHHLRFITTALYEDLIFTLQAQLASRKSSIIRNLVYYWRWRANSITESRSGIQNFKQRIWSLNYCRKILLRAGFTKDSQLYKAFLHKVTLIDLPVFLENCGDATAQYRYRMQEITYTFLRNWHLLNSKYLKQLPIRFQILYYAVQTGNLELMKKYTYQQDVGQFTHQVGTKNYQFRIPEVKDDTKLLNYLDLKDNTMRTQEHLSKMNIDDEQHLIYGDGMFKIKNIHMIKEPLSANNYHEHITAELVNITNQREIPIMFARLKTPHYKRTFRPTTSWTNSRYKFAFDYVKACSQLGAGNWIINVKDSINKGKYYIEAQLGEPTKVNKSILSTIRLPKEKLLISNYFDTNWGLHFNVRPFKLIGAHNTNSIRKPRIKNNHLYFNLQLVPTLKAKDVKPVILFTRANDFTQHLVGKIITTSKGYKIAFDLNHWNQKFMDKSYNLLLVHQETNHTIPYLFQKGSSVKTYKVQAHTQAMIAYDNDTNIKVAYRYQPFVVTKVQLENKNNLNIMAHSPYWVSPKKVNQIKIEMLSSNLKYRYLLTNQNAQISMYKYYLHIKFPLITDNRKQLQVLKGKYHFIVYLPFKNKIVPIGMNIKPVLEMPHYAKLPLKHDLAKYRIAMGKRHGFQLRILQPWHGFSGKKNRRAIAYSVLYPLLRLLPLNKRRIIFDAYWGTQYSSNERAIYKYIRKHHPKLKCDWTFKNRQIPIDDENNSHVHKIRVNSLKYWYALATAKYIFQNTNMPDQYLKRPNQIETEDLHGTFLKHMGFDEPGFKNGTQNKQMRFANRIRRWDYMTVPSDYMKQIASNAFDYHQKVLKSGFPRNDELIQNNNATYINKIKNKLHIPKNKIVVLYAPTYRKGDHHFYFDLDRLQKQLPNNYVLLVRLHYFVAHSNSFYNYPNFVYDVSDYPDINDLFLISDALITDYSSVMFDYAYLKRPMIFYAYDMKMYLNSRNRGTYLDYKHEMPGPIEVSQRGVVKDLKKLPKIKSKYHKKLNDFNKKFAQYGKKGNATQNVVDNVLNTSTTQLNQMPDKHVIFNKFWHWFKINDLQSTTLNYLSTKLPKKNIIMFESFFGTSYSDNPKAIYLYIKKHYPQYKCYWNVNKDDVPYFKVHHIPYVQRFSYKGIIKQAEAKYWVTNARRPFRWQPSKNTIVLQTWHGTPLKTIGADVNKVTMPGNNAKRYHQQVYDDNKRWTYLIAPNMYSYNIMTNAFRKRPNQMMLTGYPRNDILINHAHDKKLINHLKDTLGINRNKKVILYAPTWRDNEFIRNDEFVAHLHLKLDKIRKHYGHKVVVLVRTHYMISNHLDLSNYQDIAINVSSYPDIAELYLISDVLITDYSSVMFDYSILKRPMIFFDYDFKNYAQSTRGFYFDFKKVAPGKIVTTTNQVIQQLDAIFAGHWKLNNNYKKFIDKFDKWMDGKSSKRVAYMLLNHDNVSLKQRNIQLPKCVNIRNGALLWKAITQQGNLLQRNYIGNYKAQKHEKFVPKQVMQLQSKGIRKWIGHAYIEIKGPSGNEFWLQKDDAIKA